RKPPADVRVLAWPERLHALPGGVIVEEAGVEEVAAADVGNQPSAGFHVGVAVDVDEAGDHELAGGVDAAVHPAGERRADERHAIVLEDEGPAAQEPVSAVSQGNAVAAPD